jgi:enoyl-[acyl-carrier protein] reductase II
MAWLQMPVWHLQFQMQASGTDCCRQCPADIVKSEIKKAKKATDKPFGVNIMLMSPFCDDIAQLVIEQKLRLLLPVAGLPTKYMSAWQDAA